MKNKSCYAVVVVKVQAFTNDGRALVKSMESHDELSIAIPNSYVRELIFSDVPPAPILYAAE